MKGANVLVLVWLVCAAEVKVHAGRIWTVRVGQGNYGTVHYIDDEGIQRGLAVELIDLVCQEAGMDCRVALSPTHHCWQSHAGTFQSGGRGLLARWYDACFYMVMTVERLQVFQFSLPLFKPLDAFLWVLKGSTLDPDNLQGKTIGFTRGWTSNELCLVRSSREFQQIAEKIVHLRFDGPTGLDALKRQEIDAMFTYPSFWTSGVPSEIEKASGPIECYLGGHGMMSRKGSAFTAEWNVGFSKLKDTNNFQKFCDESNARHKHRGRPVECLV